MNKIEKHKEYLRMAKTLANLSSCAKIKVGCLFVRDWRIVTSGVNGVAAGAKHCNEIFTDSESLKNHREWSKVHEVHGEMNAIIFAAKHGIPLNGCTLYTTLQPCSECSKNLRMLGIKDIYYSVRYEENISKGIENELEKALNESGVKLHYLEI